MVRALFRGVQRSVLFLVRWALRVVLVYAVLALLLSTWKALDPPNPIVPSPETTIVVGPLADDGLPDYAAAVVAELKGTTRSEENGAIDFWQAVGSEPVPTAYRDVFFAELEMVDPGEAEISIDPYDADFEGTEIARAWGVQPEFDEPDPPTDSADLPSQEDQSSPPDTDEFISRCMERPWTRQQVRFLAEWLDAHDERIDMIVDSAAKPAFYSPPPNLLLPKPPLLFDSDLSLNPALRGAARAVMLRAMLRLSEGEVAGAWRDIEAVLRLSERLREMAFDTDLLLGAALYDMAFRAFPAWLQRADDPSLLMDVAEQLGRDDDSQHANRMYSFGLSLRTLEPLMAGIAGRENALPGSGRFMTMRIEGNVALNRCCYWLSRVQQDESAFSELSRAATLAQSGWKPAAYVSRAALSESMADIYSVGAVPSLSSLREVERKVLTRSRLMRCAMFIETFRQRTGAYPETLSDLIPDHLPEIPVDAHDKRPFCFERRGNGFLLYNASDGDCSGGDCSTGRVVDGEWVDVEDDNPPTIRVNVVRVPRPDLEFPFPMPAENSYGGFGGGYGGGYGEAHE